MLCFCSVCGTLELFGDSGVTRLTDSETARGKSHGAGLGVVSRGSNTAIGGACEIVVLAGITPTDSEIAP